MTVTKSRRYVFDASVALKWYLPEDDSKEARQWYEAIKKGKIFALAPEFLLIECANALLKHHKLIKEDVTAIIDDLTNSGLELIPLSILRIDQIIALAERYNLTIYDAIYLELARFTDVKLITTDTSLLKIKTHTRPLG